MLEDLKSDHPDGSISDYEAVIIKALLVHSACQGKTRIAAYEHLKNDVNSSRFQRYRSRYLGYGGINMEKALGCTRTRVTAIGCGEIQKDQRLKFLLPLPAVNSVHDFLRLTVTLAWLSPINPGHIGWRRAKLFFEGDGLKGSQGHKRQEADWQQVRKGTVQHEIFDLEKSNLLEDSINLYVQCGAAAGGLDVSVPYSLAVTLEIAEHERVDLYQEVRNKIRPPVKPRI